MPSYLVVFEAFESNGSRSDVSILASVEGHGFACWSLLLGTVYSPLYKAATWRVLERTRVKFTRWAFKSRKIKMSTVIEKIAGALYRSGCIKFGTFKIKSGAASPYYVDLARLLSSPKELCAIADIAAGKIREIMASERIDKLASIELKGALIVPSIACRLDLPCIVVRKEEKAYGVTGRIAGAEVAKGENILFFDDVVSEGLSKVEGIKPLQELGAQVKHLMVVVNREQGGKENLEKIGYEVHALAKISDIVDSLYRSRSISKAQADAVLDYIKR